MTDFKLEMSDYQLDDYPLADVHEYKDEEESLQRVKMKKTKRKKKGITRMILTLRS